MKDSLASSDMTFSSSSSIIPSSLNSSSITDIIMRSSTRHVPAAASALNASVPAAAIAASKSERPHKSKRKIVSDTQSSIGDSRMSLDDSASSSSSCACVSSAPASSTTSEAEVQTSMITEDSSSQSLESDHHHRKSHSRSHRHSHRSSQSSKKEKRRRAPQQSALPSSIETKLSPEEQRILMQFEARVRRVQGQQEDLVPPSNFDTHEYGSDIPSSQYGEEKIARALRYQRIEQEQPASVGPRSVHDMAAMLLRTACDTKNWSGEYSNLLMPRPADERFQHIVQSTTGKQLRSGSGGKSSSKLSSRMLHLGPPAPDEVLAAATETRNAVADGRDALNETFFIESPTIQPTSISAPSSAGTTSKPKSPALRPVSPALPSRRPPVPRQNSMKKGVLDDSADTDVVKHYSVKQLRAKMSSEGQAALR